MQSAEDAFAEIERAVAARKRRVLAEAAAPYDAVDAELTAKKNAVREAFVAEHPYVPLLKKNASGELLLQNTTKFSNLLEMK